MVGKSEKQGEEVSTFSLLRLTGEQREYLVVKIYPILDTFYFKIFFFLISTLVVFITAISAAFIVIKCFEYITRCAKVTFSYSRELFILIITCSGLHQVPDLLQEEHAAPLLLNRGQGGRGGAAFLLTSMQGVRNFLSSIVFFTHFIVVFHIKFICKLLRFTFFGISAQPPGPFTPLFWKTISPLRLLVNVLFQTD